MAEEPLIADVPSVPVAVRPIPSSAIDAEELIDRLEVAPDVAGARVEASTPSRASEAVAPLVV
jgi:hypothetical protein